MLSWIRPLSSRAQNVLCTQVCRFSSWRFQKVTEQSVTMGVAITTDQNENISEFVLSAYCRTVETWILRGYQTLQVEFLTTYTNTLQVKTTVLDRQALWMCFLKPMCGLQIFPRTTTSPLRLRIGLGDRPKRWAFPFSCFRSFWIPKILSHSAVKSEI